MANGSASQLSICKSYIKEDMIEIGCHANITPETVLNSGQNVLWNGQAPAHYFKAQGEWTHYGKLGNTPNILGKAETIPWH
jgi:hypothetical protein